MLEYDHLLLYEAYYSIDCKSLGEIMDGHYKIVILPQKNAQPPLLEE